MKCSYCEKRILFFESKIKVEDPTNERERIYLHEACYYKMHCEMKDEKIKEMEKELDNINRLNIHMLVKALNKHKKRNKNKKIKIVIDPKIYANALRDVDINEQALYIYTTKKTVKWLGMKVIVDPKITGWYIINQ